ncbi:MAG: hypothetical protein A2498_10840 [Lentisphaerae bacterium RIFOXYC12_FULL_60_16]|nr:MAG: hypothetical protein A2498_10840 [Lentisphaerae bacterium RIFOXYC12_FULL_60_16]
MLGHEEMKRSPANIWVALAAFLLSAHGQADDGNILGTGLFDTGYTFILDEVTAKSIPRWTDTNKPPPLGIDAALDVARQFISQIPARDRFRWELEEITFCRVRGHQEHWMYKVSFYEALKDFDAYEGPVQQFTVAVLMDGKVPPYRIRKR